MCRGFQKLSSSVRDVSKSGPTLLVILMTNAMNLFFSNLSTYSRPAGLSWTDQILFNISNRQSQSDTRTHTGLW